MENCGVARRGDELDAEPVQVPAGHAPHVNVGFAEQGTNHYIAGFL